MNIVYRVWCEYDIGQEDVIFASEQVAVDWCKIACEECGLDYSELRESGLIDTEELQFVSNILARNQIH